MMDSFVEAQNNLKPMSYAGCVTLFKTRQSHAARFSFMPMVMKSPGLNLSRPKTQAALRVFLTWVLCARSGRWRSDAPGADCTQRCRSFALTGFSRLTHTGTVFIWGTRIG